MKKGHVATRLRELYGTDRWEYADYPLSVMVRQEHGDSAIPGNPTECLFCQAGRDLGLRMLVFKRSMYAMIPDRETGKQRLLKWRGTHATAYQVTEYDKEQHRVLPGVYVFEPYTKKRIKTDSKQDRAKSTESERASGRRYYARRRANGGRPLRTQDPTFARLTRYEEAA